LKISRLKNMKTHSRQLFWTAIIGWAVMLAPGDAFGLGSDYPNGSPVAGSTSWPKGMDKLVNGTNRVHGFFINSADLFFFSGGATNLTAFLADYSLISGVEKHRLILHEGVGEAKSPWEKTGRPCDWRLDGCPRSWLNLASLKGTNNSLEVLQKAAQEPGYVLEVHFWTGGRIALDQVVVPRNVEVAKAK
jgi:hypothetical protein